MHQLHVGFENDPLKIEALRAFGFDEGYLQDFLATAAPGDLPARVIEVQRGRFTALRAGPGGAGGTAGAAGQNSAGGTIEVEALPSGAFMNTAEDEASYPAVGDWVVLRAGGNAGPSMIEALLPRRNAFVRKRPGETARDRVGAQVIAANVDCAFIVMAAGQDWSPRRLERYLALARQCGVRPVIVITKADLADDPEALLEEAAALAPDLRRELVCAPEGRGLESLSEWLRPGRTVVLLGSSGAGKSTLLNALAGRALADTGEVRLDDERGRHTTTHRQLYRLGNGALVIDTPGLREIQLWAEQDAVDAVFAEIDALAERCRFRDCGHGDEPGCAVRAALVAGEIDTDRFASWSKLRREIGYLDSRENPALRRAQVERWKTIHKGMRGYTKEKRSLAGGPEA